MRTPQGFDGRSAATGDGRAERRGAKPRVERANPRGDAILKPALQGGFFGAWGRRTQVRTPGFDGAKRRRDSLQSRLVAPRSRASGTNPRACPAEASAKVEGRHFKTRPSRRGFGSLAPETSGSKYLDGNDAGIPCSPKPGKSSPLS